MQASQNTTIEASITRHSALPASMRREDVDALKAQQARMTGDCKGHSPATRAAMAWIITTTAPHMRASQLAAWADAQLWLAAKAAPKANLEALHMLPERILQSIAWGEAVALQWGLRYQTKDLPTGPDPFAIIDRASPGFGAAIKLLVYDVDLQPFNDLKWKLQSYVEDPFKPVFTNWLCLPWWPDQGLTANDLEE